MGCLKENLGMVTTLLHSHFRVVIPCVVFAVMSFVGKAATPTQLILLECICLQMTLGCCNSAHQEVGFGRTIDLQWNSKSIDYYAWQAS